MEYIRFGRQIVLQTLIVFALSLALIPTIVSANEHYPLATEIVQNAKRDCNGFENGEFSATEKTITLHDLTGDGRPEEIVDASQFSCSTVASLWGGTGGTFLWVIAEGKAYEFLAHYWQVIEAGKQQVLLLAVHSSQCSDDIGPCYRAYVWQDGFRTTR